jgi:hypothetical protein
MTSVQNRQQPLSGNKIVRNIRKDNLIGII